MVIFAARQHPARSALIRHRVLQQQTQLTQVMIFHPYKGVNLNTYLRV